MPPEASCTSAVETTASSETHRRERPGAGRHLGRAAHSPQRNRNADLLTVESSEDAREGAQRAAELALWAGRPGDAVAEVQQALARFQAPDLTILCGRLLAA